MATDPTRAVSRAFDLLTVVCEKGQVSLADAARETDIPTSTALRLLRTLESSEFIQRDDGMFRPSARLLQLGAKVLGHEPLAARAQPYLEKIAAETGESVYLAVRGPAGKVLYLAQVEGTHSIRHVSWVGRTVPIESTVGTVLTGGSGPGGFLARQALLETDVTAVAAPVQGPGGTLVAALSLVGPSFRLHGEVCQRYGRLVARHATALSTELGAGAPHPPEAAR